MNAIPVVTMVLAGIVGALAMAYAFQRSARGPLMGGILGAAGGAAGSLIFMVPLNYCTFEADRKPIDVIFGILLVAVGVGLVLLPLRWLAEQWTGTGFRLSSSRVQQGMFKGRLTPWLLLAPTLIILLLFLYYPFIDNFRLSTLLTGRSAPRSRFVCVDNFTNLLSNTEYHYSVTITLVIAAAIVVIGLTLALLIATLAYQPVKGASLYRTLLVWPYAISSVVAGAIFSKMFDPASGLINYFTDNIFGVKLLWLSTPHLAVIAVILTSVWHTMSFNILFYIAGLQNIPGDLREAAAIDGANAVQRFFRVTIPLLSPITFFLIITNMTYSFFDIFGTIDFLTAGGPLKATSTMMYRIYIDQTGTVGFGIAAAQSVVLFLMVIALTIFQFGSTGRRVTYGA
jgi:sn-glycerol 3-phosphate transport system permease protein